MSTIVVGGGIAGCTVALAMRSRGAAVTLIHAPELAGAATPASAGMIAPLFESDPADPTFRLGVECASRYGEFLAGLNKLTGSDVELTGGGMLVANHTRAEHEAATLAARAHTADGLRAAILDETEAAKLEPAVAPELDSFLWLPDSSRLDCRRLAAALERAVDSAGVSRVVASASGLICEGGRAGGVQLADGRLVEAAAVVLAAGCWSGQLAGLPRRVPVRPVRGEILRLVADELPSGPVLADHAGRYLVPETGGALAGSTMDESGFEPESTEAGEASIRWAVGRLCTAAGVATAAEAWAGLRPVSDDGAPIVGPDPELEGLSYATGYGRSGILLAPLLAEIVADLALGREPEFEWHALSIDRFSLSETGARRTSV